MHPFEEHQCNWSTILGTAQAYADRKDVLLVGVGGQTNPVFAYLPFFTPGRRLAIVNSQDPRFLSHVKEKTQEDETIVLVSTKSGTTSTTLQALEAFPGYEWLLITSSSDAPLTKQALREQRPMLRMPEAIGGRFSGTCESTYLPLAIAGCDVKQIDSGAKAFYADPKGVEGFASFLSDVEKKGYTEVYLVLYGKHAAAFAPIITQLFHESCCKDGKGLTFLVMEGPDCQHHTNQRLFGGRRDMALVTVHMGKEDGVYALFDKERQAMLGEAEAQGIPSHDILFDTPSLKEAGKMMAFFQLAAIRYAQLLGVNPFDQPAVEGMKKRLR